MTQALMPFCDFQAFSVGTWSLLPAVQVLALQTLTPLQKASWIHESLQALHSLLASWGCEWTWLDGTPYETLTQDSLGNARYAFGMVSFPHTTTERNHPSVFLLEPDASVWQHAEAFQSWLMAQTSRLQTMQPSAEALQNAYLTREGASWSPFMLSRVGSAWTYWAYELGVLLEPQAFAPSKTTAVSNMIPSLQQAIPCAVIQPAMAWVGIDWDTSTFYVAWHHSLSQTQRNALSETLQSILGFSAETLPQWQTSRVQAEAISWQMPQATYEQCSHTLQQGIAKGEFYQANLSLQAHLKVPRSYDPLTDWVARYTENPAPFSALWYAPYSLKAQGASWLLSHSPERLILQTPEYTHTHLLASWKLSTRPIAGTRSRGTTSAEQKALEEALRSVPKEQAEHAMLVDLLRNDLGRLCDAGSVKVTEYQTIERYRYVTHLVSNIEGKCEKPSSHLFSLLQAMFPGGTITGCPKWRCMTWLFQQENVPRTFYTGSSGYWHAHTQTIDWNILIRSAMFYTKEAKLICHGGAGIVADSIASHEYKESLKKMRHFTH
ncbi:MAG: chorismate-binding protein [Vampirovibrionales bacterium]